jgi:molybdopterin-guanine dinucleotide biosynthesis protein A
MREPANTASDVPTQPGARIAAVLAGGAGSRLGRPKATVPLGGAALIAHVVEASEAAGLRPVVVAKAGSELPALEAAVLREPAEPRHPLVGLIAALRDADEAIVALGCDTPFLVPPLLRHLAELEAAAAAVEAGGRLHPLIARYSPSVLPSFERSLDAGSSLTAAVEELAPVVIGEQELEGFGDPERISFNVNTPEDLTRAEEMLDEEGPQPGAG